MANVRIQTGDKAPIEALVVDAARNPITGLTDLQLKVRRRSDDYFFDWVDDTFKPGASVTQIETPLTEVNATFAAGVYKLDKAGHEDGFDTSSIVNPSDDDTYLFVVDQNPRTAANVPQAGEVAVGDFLDFIDAHISDASDSFVVLMTFSYNKDADRFDMVVWIERRNLLFNTPAEMGTCALSIYDRNGTLLFTVSDTTPDSQGIYKMERVAPGFASDQMYYAVATIPVSSAPTGFVSGAKGMFTL